MKCFGVFVVVRMNEFVGECFGVVRYVWFLVVVVRDDEDVEVIVGFDVVFFRFDFLIVVGCWFASNDGRFELCDVI